MGGLAESNRAPPTWTLNFDISPHHSRVNPFASLEPPRLDISPTHHSLPIDDLLIERTVSSIPDIDIEI